MKTVKLNFRTQIDDQYQDPDTNRWVSPLVLESMLNIYEVSVTACPSWDSASYDHTEDDDTERIKIHKGVGDAFTPNQVRELIDEVMPNLHVSIKCDRGAEIY